MEQRKPISRCKYGMFVHFVAPLVFYSNGERPENIDRLIDRFDADGFVRQIADTGAEYLILTAWHYKTVPLYPSPVTDRWRGIKSPRRDLLGEIIDGLNKRGVQVVLYTHPRDGHDFNDADRIRTGWGIGSDGNRLDSPNPETFDYSLWNTYIRELYTEMAERYADRISGVYIDGMGPKVPWEYEDSDKGRQVVDYLMIRDILKTRNPALELIQNHPGYLFSTDMVNSEAYNYYLMKHLHFKGVSGWYAGRPAMSITAFLGQWGVYDDAKYGDYAPFMEPEDMARYTMFHASCSVNGGVTWATGPFAEGSVWPVGAIECLHDTGVILSRFRDSILDAACSRSYPTVPGDTLEDRDNRFWMTGEDGQTEYLHCMRVPEDGELSWGLPEDGITLADPRVVNGDMRVLSFGKSDTGYTMKLAGNPDSLDTVIRFARKGESRDPGYEWINDSDKRIDYRPGWVYDYLAFHSDARVADEVAGCFGLDAHFAEGRTSLFFAFRGSILELYGIREPGAGSAEVYIDGVFCGNVSQVAKKREVRACCFRSTDLHGGWHILQLYTKGEGTFWLDALKVID